MDSYCLQDGRRWCLVNLRTLGYAFRMAPIYPRVRKYLFRLPPEMSHGLSIKAARAAQLVAAGPMEAGFRYADGSLGQSLFGHNFANPVGLAAGFDKDGKLVRFCESLGFGFAEVGSVTRKASRGNRKPRMFRIDTEEALINRVGLPSQGAARVAKRLARTKKWCHMPVGVNIAATNLHDTFGPDVVVDYRHSFRLLAPHADYVVLNISCPNTTDGKTFEAAGPLEVLLRTVFSERARMSLNVPILLKLAPPTSPKVVFDSQIEEILEVGANYGVGGYVASNTIPTAAWSGDLPNVGPGGLSGPPLAPLSRRLVAYIYRRTKGRVPIIGVGGVNSAESAYLMLRAGASLIQLYTGLVYGGPKLPKSIKIGLARLMQRDGITSIGQIIGTDVA